MNYKTWKQHILASHKKEVEDFANDETEYKFYLMDKYPKYVKKYQEENENWEKILYYDAADELIKVLHNYENDEFQKKQVYYDKISVNSYLPI